MLRLSANSKPSWGMTRKIWFFHYYVPRQGLCICLVRGLRFVLA